jgi:hypothetical protein
VFTVAAPSMKRYPSKGYAQAAPPVVIVVGFGLTQILFGSIESFLSAPHHKPFH